MWKVHHDLGTLNTSMKVNLKTNLNEICCSQITMPSLLSDVFISDDNENDFTVATYF